MSGKRLLRGILQTVVLSDGSAFTTRVAAFKNQPRVLLCKSDLNATLLAARAQKHVKPPKKGRGTYYD